MLLISLSGPDQCGSAGQRSQRSQICQIRLEISGQMWAGPENQWIAPNGSISHCWAQIFSTVYNEVLLPGGSSNSGIPVYQY